MVAMPMATFDSIMRELLPPERFVLYGSVLSEEVRHGGDYYVRSPKHGVFVKVSSLPYRTVREHNDYGIWDRLDALRNAPFYRMAITDESLPAGIEEGQHMMLDGDPFFCRQMMIASLGRIGYHPACPDLREAMLHDLDPYIRGWSATALGRIGDKRYTGDLIEAARGGQGEATDALGLMKDEAAVPALREMLEDSQRDHYLARFTRDYRRATMARNRIMDITEALNRIGGSGKLAVSEALSTEDPWLNWSAAKGVEYSKI